MLVVVPRIRRATELTQAAVGGMGSALERSLGSFRPCAWAPRSARSGPSAWRLAERGGGGGGGRLDGADGGSAGLAVQVSFLAVLGVGGARVASGTLAVSSLIAFLLYLLLLGEPITALVNGVSQLQAGLAAVVRLREVQALPVEPKPVRRQPPSPPGRRYRPRWPAATCGSATAPATTAPGSTAASPSSCPPAG